MSNRNLSEKIDFNESSTVSKKIPNDYVFTRWMGTWEKRLSIWSNSDYSDALLGYIGKIYGQQANVYHYFNRLWTESLYHSFDELDFLHFLIERLGKIPGAKSSLIKRQETSRIESRFNELKSIVNCHSNTKFQITTKFPLDQLLDVKSIDSYLDFGCGNGLITRRFGDYFQLKSDQIFGCDVFNSENDQLTFISIDEEQTKISLADQSVNLITCLVTLHHVSNLDRILRELARIIRAKGYLVLREHDCKLERSLMSKYLNFIHAIMIIAQIGEFAFDFLPNCPKKFSWSDEKKKIIQYTKSIQYKTRQEWQEKFESVGFDLIATYDYDRKKTSNPQQLFYALYQRRSDQPAVNQ